MLRRRYRTRTRDTLTCTRTMRAGDGNRNRMTSLEGWGSTIELRPRGRQAEANRPQ